MSCCRKKGEETIGLVMLGGTDVSIVTQAIQNEIPTAPRFSVDSMYLPTSNVPLHVLYPNPHERLHRVGDLANKVAVAARTVSVLEVENDPFYSRMNGVAKVSESGTYSKRVVNVYTPLPAMKAITPAKLITFATLFTGEPRKSAKSIDYLTRQQVSAALDTAAKSLQGTDMADARTVKHITQNYVLKQLGFADGSVKGVHISSRWPADLTVNSTNAAKAAREIISNLGLGGDSVYADPQVFAAGFRRGTLPRHPQCKTCARVRADAPVNSLPCGDCLNVWADIIKGSNFDEQDQYYADDFAGQDGNPSGNVQQGLGTQQGGNFDQAPSPQAAPSGPLARIQVPEGCAASFGPSGLPSYYPMSPAGEVCVNGSTMPWHMVTVLRRSLKELEEEHNSFSQPPPGLPALKSELARFWDAVRKLMSDAPFEVLNAFSIPRALEVAPGSSRNMTEWYRLGCVHGGPSLEGNAVNGARPDEYCHHGKKSFGMWHRGYLIQLETSLRRADFELGGNGCIGLPFWDAYVDGIPWSLNDFNTLLGSGSGVFGHNAWQGVHFERNPSPFPDGFDVSAFDRDHSNFIQLLEVKHGKVHGDMGTPLGYLERAAFDPAFWLHHCNVDRIYQMYIQKKTIPVVVGEYKNYFDTATGKSENWKGDFVGFTPPPGYKGEQVLKWLNASVMFETTPMLYVFQGAALDFDKWAMSLNRAPPIPPIGSNMSSNMIQSAKAVKILATFPNQNLREVHGMWTIMAVKKQNPATAIIPCAETQKTDAYLGRADVFRGNPNICLNCQTQPPYDIVIDLHCEKLGDNISVYNLADKVEFWCWNIDHRQAARIDDRNETWIPESLRTPILEGPLFANCTADQKFSELYPEEQKKVFASLKRYGYLKSGDGSPGDIKSAISLFQERWGLTDRRRLFTVETKKWLSEERMEDFPDFDCQKPIKPYAFLKNIGNQINYVILNSCNSLCDNTRTNAEIEQCFARWERAFAQTNFKVTFNRVDCVTKPHNLEIGFIDKHTAGYPFDGKGGLCVTVVRAQGPGDMTKILFDDEDEYLYCDVKEDGERFKFSAALTHEIGILVGLPHTCQAGKSSFMSPYYCPEAQIAEVPAEVCAALKDLYK